MYVNANFKTSDFLKGEFLLYSFDHSRFPLTIVNHRGIVLQWWSSGWGHKNDRMF